MTRVACMVQKGAEITAERCVQAQADERCWCIKAVAALQAIDGPDLRSLRDRTQLVNLRARCAGMYRQPAERRFAGPALRVYNEEIQAKTEIAKPFEAHLLKALDLEVQKPSGSGIVAQTAPRNEPAVQSDVVPVAPTTGLHDVERCCASVDCFVKMGRKSPHEKCHACRERDLRRSVAKPRFCKAEGCKTQLRAPNLGDFCSICRKRHERLGEPMGEPSKETVKPVETKTLAGVVDAAVEKMAADLKTYEYRLIGDPPDPKTLSHEYLLACVQEARRRLIQLDEHFTIITKEQ